MLAKKLLFLRLGKDGLSKGNTARRGNYSNSCFFFLMVEVAKMNNCEV